jgi:hypothetical protein
MSAGAYAALNHGGMQGSTPPVFIYESIRHDRGREKSPPE